MTTANLRAEIIRRFRIVGSTLNADIDECVIIAVESLSPYIKKSTVDTSLTAQSTTDSLTIPAAGADLEKVYTKGTSNSWEKFDDWTRMGDVIYLRSWLEDSTSVRLHLKVPYVIGDLSVIPQPFKRPIIDIASGEFATMLAGDKVRYNIYAQSNGARAVDNMLDLATYYEEKARRQLVLLGGGEALG